MVTHFEELMAKKLANQCNKIEEQELANWLLASPVNQKEFDAFAKIWHNSEQASLKVNVDAAWHKVQQKTKPKMVLLPNLLFKYAAIIAVFVLLGFWAITLLKPATIIQTASNQIKQVTLPDGSKVWLHEFATLTYKNNLKGKSREVILNGLAFFDVKPDKEHPFVIVTNHGKVEVLGTSFEVSAYKTDTFERVAVKTGKVSFAQNGGQQVGLQANEQAIANGAGNIKTTIVATKELVSWTENKLVFNNDDLWQVAEKISRYFHVQVVLTNPKIGNCHFTGTYQNPSMAMVLDALNKTLSISPSIKGNQVRLNGNGCSAIK